MSGRNTSDEVKSKGFKFIIHDGESNGGATMFPGDFDCLSIGLFGESQLFPVFVNELVNIFGEEFPYLDKK